MTTQRFDDPHHLATAAVVVGVDGSKGSDIAVRWAAEFAASRGRELDIVHGMDLLSVSRVYNSYEAMAPSVIDGVRARAAAVVADAELAAQATVSGVRISTQISDDSPGQVLIGRSHRAYAVVLGATGTAGTLAHLGSTLLAVTAHAEGTVAVVRTDPDAGDTIHHEGPVVVGVDGGPVSEAAIATAFMEAAERRAELIAVHTWSDWNFGSFAGREGLTMPDIDSEEAEIAILAERLAGWQEKYPDVTVTQQVYPDGPREQLRTWSRSAQLVVVGSRGRGGFEGLLLGSTANYLVQHAFCPVMVVHAHERAERS